MSMRRLVVGAWYFLRVEHDLNAVAMHLRGDRLVGLGERRGDQAINLE